MTAREMIEQEASTTGKWFIGSSNWCFAAERVVTRLCEEIERLKLEVDDGGNAFNERQEDCRDNRKRAEAAERRLRDLVDAIADYRTLVKRELDSVVGLAYAHGWRSQLVDEGEVVRGKLDAALAAIKEGE